MTSTLSFGRWLQQQRRARDLTQAELAQRVGCAVSTIRKLEAGVRRPSRQIAARLADQLDLPPDARAGFIQAARTPHMANPSESLPQTNSLAPPHQLERRLPPLPVSPTALIGRAQEVRAACAYLRRPEVRLLTLIGPPGIGKTRLSLQVAAELHDAFADGIWFLPLATISDPDLVAAAIAQLLGVTESAAQPLVGCLVHQLRDKQLLLLLDNFEQVVAAAPLLTALLAAAPGLKLLVTSRAALHLSVEHELVVPPLVPCAAVELFVARAQACTCDFQLTAANAPAVAEICAHLEGVPLAIELAAARSKLFTPQGLLARLASRLTGLTGGARDLPARQQTLRNAIDWSHNLLAGAEQLLFRRLGVFVGGTTLDAVDVVCNITGDLPMDSADGVALLLNQSLLQRGAGADGEPRFTMLETIREYALEQLMASGEATIIERQHADYYRALAEAAEPELRGPQQVAWLVRLESEHANLRAALGWALGHAGETAGRLSGALWRFWLLRGYVCEGRTWLDAVLAQRDGVSAAVRAKALSAAGVLAHHQGDYCRAAALCEESLALSQHLGDPSSRALALRTLGRVTHARGDAAAACALYAQSLALCQELGDTWGCAQAAYHLAHERWLCGHDPAVRPLLEESLAIFREVGDRWGAAKALKGLGDITLMHGDATMAQRMYRESLMLGQELGTNWFIAACVEGLAGVAACQGQPRRVLQLYGAAAGLRDAIGAPVPPAERDAYVQAVATARAQLGTAMGAAAWAEGQALSMEQAIAAALGDGNEDSELWQQHPGQPNMRPFQTGG